MSDQDERRIAEFRERVKAERLRQLRKWGPQTHDVGEWISILGEEFGEICHAHAEMWISAQNLEKLLEELVEVAAVAEAAYADLASHMLRDPDDRESPQTS